MRRGTAFLLSITFTASALVACAAGGGPPGPVVIERHGPDLVATWNKVAEDTFNTVDGATGSASERKPFYAFDLATLHVAIYDAVIAIDGGHRPFMVSPTTPSVGASQEAAANAAAYGVLKALAPDRARFYEATWRERSAAIADSDAKARGIAIGQEVATAVLRARADDNREAPLAPFVFGTQPGDYRGPGAIGRDFAASRPFALTSADQFRPAGPPALNSDRYARDVDETRSLGGATSTRRTPEQATRAVFHTERPDSFWPRNLRPFLTMPATLADQARLGALIWVVQADSNIACFEAKYAFRRWRPFSAIAPADPTWKPFLPTPPHPEYPAAHGCVGAASAEAIRQFFGTRQVAFDFSSLTSGTSRHYASTDDLVDDITASRIAGGMHFRFSMEDGEVLGARVGDWVASRYFK